MDGTTNLNNTGSGVPNWSGQGEQPPLKDGAPKTGAAGETKKLGQTPETDTEPVGTKTETQATATIETDLWTDIVADTPETNPNTTIEEPPTPYVTYSDRPNLKPSTVNDPKLAEKAIDLVQNPPPEKQQELFTNYVTNLFPTSDPTKTNDEYASVVVTDPQILKMAQDKGVSPGLIQKNVQFEQNAQFSALVSTYPEDVANKLTFARFVPEGAKNLSPELQADLASIEKQVRDGVANSFGFADDWTGVPADATDFVGDLTNQADNSFEKLLDAKVADGSLSAADAQTLKSMHYGLATGTPTLKNLLITLENQSVANLQTKFGMDATFQPKADVAFYNNVVNGDFAQTFKKNVDKYIASKATPEQQALLKKHEGQIQANPDDPAIPESIRELAKQQQLLLKSFPDPDKASLPDNLKITAKGLIAATTTATIEKYGLDANWKPTITSLTSANADMALINRTQAGVNVATEAIDQATQLGNSMPDGPEKEQFLAFLQIISKALGALQDSLYAMQAGQSNAARNANRGKLDLALNDLEQQRKAAEKSEANVKKMVSMGPMGKIFMWIIKIVLLAVSSFFGPVAYMLALALVMDQVVADAMGEKKNQLEKTMEAMTKNLPPAASAALKILMVSIIACVSPWLAIYLFTSEAHIVEDIMKATGASQEAQAIAAMIINMALMLAIMIPLMIVTGGAAAPMLTSMIGAVVGQVAVEAGTFAAKAIRIFAYMIQQIPTMLTIAADGVKLNNNILLSFNDIIKGESEAYTEKLQAIIKLMKELIAKLMEIMSGTSASIVSINEFQGSKWSAAGQISSEIAG